MCKKLRRWACLVPCSKLKMWPYRRRSCGLRHVRKAARESAGAFVCAVSVEAAPPMELTRIESNAEVEELIASVGGACPTAMLRCSIRFLNNSRTASWGGGHAADVDTDPCWAKLEQTRPKYATHLADSVPNLPAEFRRFRPTLAQIDPNLAKSVSARTWRGGIRPRSIDFSKCRQDSYESRPASPELARSSFRNYC